ncbi:hypothetical protein K438DRAFT_2019803 [Mycena galopus ATCC 62051]|nr:hypothetical protein K438DRAFT_2019803 [Mycena galopus ATCC 62051]
MSEIAEVYVFRVWIQRFITHAKENLQPGDLQIQSLYTDLRDSDLNEMETREQRLLEYSTTFNIQMLRDDYHVLWATRLERLADSVPDSHGLLIPKVWASFPDNLRSQISPNYDCWPSFCAAIVALRHGVVREPAKLPLPWFMRSTAGNMEYDLPSNTRLVTKLTRYSPPTWRGPRPDRRPPALVPPPPDRVWEDPIPTPASMSSLAPLFPSPRSMHHRVHGDVFGSVAPRTLAGSKKSASLNATPSSSRSPPSPPKPRRQKKAKDKMSTTATLLTSYKFTVLKSTPHPAPPSVAGVSAHLASLGVKRNLVKPEHCTDRDIDHLLYLFPVYLFRALLSGGDLASCGLELITIEHDSRSLILNLGSGCIEVEPLLHTSPQIFENGNWNEVTRVPADKRGFKVVIAFGMKTYTLAFLSNDNLCYTYWYSRADIVLARSARVPDVVFDYWAWCKYVVHWLGDQDLDPRWDRRPVSYVMSMPGQHPMRGVGRYTSDELSRLSGIPPHTLWGDAAVLRYDHMLSVHKQLWCSMSNHKKQLVLQYNHLSRLSHEGKPDSMRHAPWPFDLADLTGAVLLPGHMGPAIVSCWHSLVDSQGLAATTPEMRARYRSKLPPGMSEVQRLAFKPIVDMTPFETQMLDATRGSAINPVVEYLQKRRNMYPSQPNDSLGRMDVDMQCDVWMDSASSVAVHATLGDDNLSTLADDDLSTLGDDDLFAQDAESIAAEALFYGALPILTDSECESDDDEEMQASYSVLPQVQRIVQPPESVTSAVPIEDLALIRDASTIKKLPTILYRSTHKPIFHTWTALLLPKITTAPSPAYRPAGSSVLLQCADTLRRKKTLRTIKETSKLYTVGPMDFCGHARAVPRGKGWVISLCHWDLTLSEKNQRFVMDSWNALGAWPKGFRKDKHNLVKKAVAFKAAARRLLRKAWTLDREITDRDVDIEVKRRKALHREAAYQKALRNAAEAAVGNARKRACKPRAKKGKFNARAGTVARRPIGRADALRVVRKPLTAFRRPTAALMASSCQFWLAVAMLGLGVASRLARAD